MYLKGYVLVLIQEHVQLANTDSQITIRKFIWDVKSKCSKLSPLQSHPMKHTQGKEKVLEHISLQEGTNVCI